MQWYAIITLMGLAAWPLAFRLLPGLPGRGAGISRALGLLLAAYIFWLLASLGLLRNTPGAMILAVLIVAALSVYAWFQGDSPLDWLRDPENRRFVITAEVLFIVAFAAWALVRAGNPDLVGTEKPMELAFLNGIRISDAFPPRDPWLAGYSISYYYLGYVMAAMLADLSAQVSGVAFNLMVALLFGLTAQGAYAAAYNLIRSQVDRPVTARLGALLAPVFVLVSGNLAAFLDLVRTQQLLPAAFWAWLDIKEMAEPVAQRVWPVHDVRFLWWWRSSRVIHDRDPTGVSIGLQPIDEFPAFSFLFADMHPHVLALPFVLLAIVLAFNAMVQQDRLTPPQLGLYALAFGGLAFLNAWDLPIYLFVLVAALIVRSVHERGGMDLASVLFPVLTGLLIGVGGLALVLPWVISFTSQAGGILPNALFPTRLHQFWVMFGVFLPVIIWFLVATLFDRRSRPDVLFGGTLSVGLLVVLAAFMMALGVAAIQVDAGARDFVLTSMALPAETPAGTVLAQVVVYRLSRPLTALFLTVLLGGVLAVLIPQPERYDVPQPEGLPAASLFALVLILTGLLLTLGPEFLYLRDNFGQRLNTIFKFYYAAWVLFAVASAYASTLLLTRGSVLLRAVFGLLLTLLVGASLVYLAFGLPSRGVDLIRTDGEPPLTLDGLAYI
ncbi:MAG: hypothetical protein GYB64_11810, partial [Chloroflexi bacterium]|nr:hypothetical protein [Chloroflexota bacterium]